MSNRTMLVRWRQNFKIALKKYSKLTEKYTINYNNDEFQEVGKEVIMNNNGPELEVYTMKALKKGKHKMTFDYVGPSNVYKIIVY